MARMRSIAFAVALTCTLSLATLATAQPAPPPPPAEPASEPAPPPPAYTREPVVLPPPTYEAVEAQKPSSRDIVFAYNRGLRFGISPGIMIAPSSGQVGFSIAGDVRYGFELGPMVMAPGIRLAGYFPPGDTILIGLGTLRLTFPVGPVGPYVVGGAGPGWIKDRDEVGIAWLAGAGFMVHIGTRFGIGAEANYQAIAGTPFDALFIGPQFLFGF